MFRMWRFNRILLTGKDFIKNSDSPICLNCLHFIRPTKQEDDYELYGRCKKFGKMNMINGTIKYGLASDCRLDDNKCGDIATEYVENQILKK